MAGSNGVDGKASDGGRGLISVHDFYIKQCDFGGLICQEELILKGVSQILEELGCSTDGTEDVGDNAEIDIPALALWTLGKVTRRAADELLQKLEIVGDRLRAVGIPEVLQTRLAKGSGEAETSHARAPRSQKTHGKRAAA
jgi:hypothetical protein